MQIDGLNKKPEPIIETLGTFKLKDKIGRNAVEIDLSKASRPLVEAKSLYIVKVRGSNNKIEVKIQWKPMIKKEELKPEEVKKND